MYAKITVLAALVLQTGCAVTDMIVIHNSVDAGMTATRPGMLAKELYIELSRISSP